MPFFVQSIIATHFVGRRAKSQPAWRLHRNAPPFTRACTWHSLFVQVPQTQMILELISDQQQPIFAAARELEPRITDRAALMIAEWKGKMGTGVGSVLKPLTVNRAASDLTKIESFYLEGMKTKATNSISSANMTKKCFLWTGAKVDVCFTNRPDAETSGAFKVGDFEAMMNKVHATVLKNPDCENDKWEDNHYAIDSPGGGSFDYIIEYIDAHPEIPYFCASNSRQIHYVFDPTGWGIQLDVSFTKGPARCLGSGDDDEFELDFVRQVQQPGNNPACDIGNCTAP